LKGDRERAEVLERRLHDLGFDAVLVDHHEIAAAARKGFYATLIRLGVVVLSWADKPIRPKDRELLAELAGESYFEFSGSAGTDDLPGAVVAAERLRSTGHTPEGRRH
jgi:hypothetical protein